MSSHNQAVEEVMTTFGMTAEEAEQVVDLEEVGFVMDETGAILPDVDPDAPITLPWTTETEGAAQWN